MNKDLNTDKMWLSQDDASDLLNIRPKTLRKNCRDGLFSFQIKKINNKTVYFVLLKTLPVKYQEKYFNNNVIDENILGTVNKG